MKRGAWLLAALLLLLELTIAVRAYPHAKPWMRASYLKGWETLNWITGNDFPPPDRFK